MRDAELQNKIIDIKRRLGGKLVILCHHYQREEVIRFADFRGDSYGLSKKAAETDAEFIVFCGVHFMAEAAKILARPDQRVFIPEMTAGCPMADMALPDDVEDAWNAISEITEIDKVVPMAYMNTSAKIKAFCGERGGIICTSSNAPKAFNWAFSRGEKIFFLPDENLGRNTARTCGISEGQMMLLGPSIFRNSRTTGRRARLFLWPGFCHVHTFFTLGHIREARARYPGCRIIVHPECREDVVKASDAAASTEGIVEFVDSSPGGSTIVIGTEINLVSRLASENADKQVVPLARSLCPNMFKSSLKSLARLLESIVKNEPVNEILVKEDIIKNARLALSNMLSL